MPTARTVITHACRLLGYTRSGMTLPVDIETDGRNALNDMIGVWRNESLLVSAIREDIFTLTINLKTYTIGPTGATFTAPRPTYIKDANLILQQSTPVIRLPLQILRDSSEWAAIGVQDITNSIPGALYYSPTVPNGTIKIYPQPLLAYQIELFSWAQLDTFADIATTNYDLAPGYESALKYNLAVELAPMIPDKMKQGRLELVIARARELKAILKAKNATPRRLYSDVPSGGGLDPGNTWRTRFYQSGNIRMAG